jgi:hypothetical protein
MNIKPFTHTMALMLALCSSPELAAQETLQLEGTEITGNKELPMMLYILPWKSVERFDIESPPIASIMDVYLVTLDRSNFKRSIFYHHGLFSLAEPVLQVTVL